ncbi:integrating conjugative element protein [Pseudomonas lurida]|jgi:integrating conjugative element protein (TIGR03765 family)|uniref:Integrating conjugative element protein n=1 Tax=Pseudomonas lurida TaxID=244566 RepID=A0ABY9FXH2_9PSED|nr:MULTISPECIES: integrating conjugative element protein [Pseudomonas]MBC3248234.1 integrating conjugative element protein [Pseudomonas lurida]WLH07895.1 integrating conjugative element protein [Pseudomonas lurida]
MKRILSLMLLLCSISPIVANASSLIVVKDRRGVSALPYYQDLVPEPTGQSAPLENIGVRGQGSFPVRSDQLSPGELQGRVINAPGLQPLFLIGDDAMSKAWLSQRRDQLQQLNAIGIVVNVASAERFAEVQRWAGGLQMVPAPSNDLAQRLGIKHYPLLITATAVQQ